MRHKVFMCAIFLLYLAHMLSYRDGFYKKINQWQPFSYLSGVDYVIQILCVHTISQLQLTNYWLWLYLIFNMHRHTDPQTEPILMSPIFELVVWKPNWYSASHSPQASFKSVMQGWAYWWCTGNGPIGEHFHVFH